MRGFGLSEMIQTGAKLEAEFPSVEVLAFERGPGGEDYTMDVGGKYLFFLVALRGDRIILSAAPMDAAEEPDTLLRIEDTKPGWETVRGVIAALERHEIKSLKRPIEAGLGADGWVIG